MFCAVGGAQHDLQSDFHHLRNAVINEEASLLQGQDLSSIKHDKSQEKGVIYSVRPVTSLDRVKHQGFVHSCTLLG